MHRIKTTVETKNVLNSRGGSCHVVEDFVAGDSSVGGCIATGGGGVALESSVTEQTAKKHHRSVDRGRIWIFLIQMSVSAVRLGRVCMD